MILTLLVIYFYCFINSKEDQMEGCFLYKNSKCVDCFPEFQLNVEEGICVPCPKACLECKNGICIDCLHGYYLYNEKCYKKRCLGVGCSRCNVDGVCEKCYSLNFFLKDGDCIKCMPGCKRCDEKDVCLECYNGFTIRNKYELKDGKCIRCPNYCIRCKDGICLQCKEKRRLMNGKCIKCSENCVYCDKKGECTKCDYNYNLIDKRCKKCPEYCAYCTDGRCTKCKNDDYWITQNGTCEMYPEGCIEILKEKWGSKHRHRWDLRIIEKGGDRCLDCRRGYELNGRVCVECPENCDWCSDGICLECSDYNYKREILNGICIDCPEKCNWCKDGECEICEHYTKLVDGKCIEIECPKGCNNCEEGYGCFSCKDGYWLNKDKECIECPREKHCSSCDKNRCTICHWSYELKDGWCLPCPSFCDECKDGACVECWNDKDFTLKDGECIKHNKCE